MPVAIVYIVANLALAIHIYHGAWSMFQSLGLNNPKWNDARRKFAVGFAVLIGVGQHQLPAHGRDARGDPVTHATRSRLGWR